MSRRLDGPRVVGIREAARLLCVHENTIRNWIDRGWLRAETLPSGFRRVPLSEINRLLDGMPLDR